MRCRSHSDGQECPGISGHRLAGESETCVHLPLPNAGLQKGWTVIRPIRYRKHDTRGVLRADHKATRLSGQLVNRCNLMLELEQDLIRLSYPKYGRAYPRRNLLKCRVDLEYFRPLFDQQNQIKIESSMDRH